MRYLYVGSFPPPYGGVTNKNEMLYAALSDEAVSIAAAKKRKGLYRMLCNWCMLWCLVARC